MPAPVFDLQSHSLHSDGELSPAEVVYAAGRAGVQLLALTDHDTVDGVAEALEAGARNGVRVVAAVEISAVDAGHEDLHILGFAIDHRRRLLADRLAAARADRELRAQRMVHRLRELGWEVDQAPLAALRDAGKPLGRPHLAAAVLGHPANAPRLAREAHRDVSSFIRAYLVPGAGAYQSRTNPCVGEAVEWIHRAGGIAIWAHPFWDIKSEREVNDCIEHYRDLGLDGVETFYPTHTAAQTALLADRCEAHGLLSTGSSDFHGPHHRLFNKFLAFDLHGRSPMLGPLAR